VPLRALAALAAGRVGCARVGIRYNSSATPNSGNALAKDAPRKSVFQRLSSLLTLPSSDKTEKGESNVRKLAELAIPERKTLGIAVGLLVVSSSVSMLVPLTVGKLIDFFSSNSVSSALRCSSSHTVYVPWLIVPRCGRRPYSRVLRRRVRQRRSRHAHAYCRAAHHRPYP
jgi:hypothetical protein